METYPNLNKIMTEEKETKEFLIRKPFAGSMTVVVEAETEEEALEKAYELFSDPDGYSFQFSSKKGVELEEWDVYDKLFQGNISYINCYETEVEEW